MNNKSAFKKSSHNIKRILGGIYKLNFLQSKIKGGNVVLTAGGTGGHIVPAMKVASDLISQGKKVYFMTDKRFKNYESLFNKRDFFSSPDLKIIETPISSFSGSSIFSFAKNCFLTFFQVLILFFKIRPRVVIGFGSYVSFFPLLISVLTFRFIVIHEQNVLLGRVNRFFARFAKTILLSFPDVSYIPKKLYNKIKNKLIISGYPSFAIEDSERRLGKIMHDLTTKEEIIICITGGGQGAKFFSSAIPPAIVSIAKSYPKKIFKVYQQVLQNDIPSVLEYYAQSGIPNIHMTIKPFFDNIPEILKEADIAIIRGGAGSIIETANAKVFSIIVPIPNSIYDHQDKNARMISSNNGAIMLEEANCTPERVAMVISRVLSDGLFYFPVVNTASDIFKNDASQIFSSIILYSDLEYLNSYE